MGPLASEPVLALLKAFQTDGLEVGIAADRKVVTDLLVAVCQERAQRNRKCAVQWVLGDLLRRVKQEKVQIPGRVVKGVVAALVKAGALIHPDGEPIRAGTATFVAPADAEALRERLDAFLREVLASHDVPFDAPGVEEFLRGPAAPAPATPVPVVAEAEAEAPAAPAAPRERRGRGRRASDKGEAAAAEPVEAASADARADDVAVEDAAEDGSSSEAPAARRRSRRGGRRGRRGAGEPAAES